MKSGWLAKRQISKKYCCQSVKEVRSMAKMRTPAMEKYDLKRARRKGNNANPKFDSWRRFTRNRTAIVGLCILVVMMIFVIGANRIAPYN